MKLEAHPTLIEEAEEKTSLAKMVDRAKETCKYCRPLTPITCTTGCDVWNLRNELRKLYAKLGNPDFMKNLLNTLKNRRRLKILEMLQNERHSLVKLQKKLKKQGYHHSQETILTEYINPLAEAGLVKENNDRYHATTLGCEFNSLIGDFCVIEELLPPHSECYEEKTIETLSEGSKTYKELKSVIPPKSLSRVLNRLQEANLTTKSNENSYMFYYKTKRNSDQEKLSPTEKRVYRNIPEDGITAQELTDQTDISLRRTYKYLRKLRGKKLVFRRKRPRIYILTSKGSQVAKLLEEVHDLVVQFEKAHHNLQIGI